MNRERGAHVPALVNGVVIRQPWSWLFRIYRRADGSYLGLEENYPGEGIPARLMVKSFKIE